MTGTPARDLSGDTPPEVTELRIHGVGGASPEEVLEVPHVRLVAGSEEAGFFRPAAWLASEREWSLEAYSWGGITSRSRSRALWIFLLPFALLNVAGWMTERDGDDPDDARPEPAHLSRRRSRRVALVRFEALITTAVFTLLIAVLTIELIGYRCTALAECRGTWFVAPWQWWADDPLEGVALGTAVAALILVAIAAIANTRRHPLLDAPDERGDPARSVAVSDEQMWKRPDIADRLNVIHLSVALSLISLAGLEAGGRVVADWDAHPWLMLANGTVIAISAGLLFGLGRLSPTLGRATSAAAMLLLIVTVVTIWGLRPVREPDGALISVLGRVVFGVFLALFLFRWLVYVWRRVRAWVTSAADRSRRDAPASDDGAGGTGAGEDITYPLRPDSRRGAVVASLRRWAASKWSDDPVVLLSLRAAVPVLGAGIAVAVGSGILLRVQSILGTDYPTEVLDRVAVFGLGWIVLVVVTATWVWFSNPGRKPSEILAEDLGGKGVDENVDRLWLQQISSAESVARITDHVETVITVPAVIMMAAVVALTAGAAGGVIGLLAGPASWVLSLVPVALILAFNSLYRSRNFRRTLGIIWDVVTFWPKWFHPWAPPSYGERAVPHVRRRLQVLTREGGAVVLSAHSQGTVVAAAALAQMEEGDRRRVAVVTHGSPLTRLYARYFGDVFAVDLYRHLAGTLGPGRGLAWSNLHRYTDYIGGVVFEPGGRPAESTSADDGFPYQDRRLFDPPQPEPLMEGDPRPGPLNHSNYYGDPEYHSTVEGFVRRFREG